MTAFSRVRDIGGGTILKVEARILDILILKDKTLFCACVDNFKQNDVFWRHCACVDNFKQNGVFWRHCACVDNFKQNGVFWRQGYTPLYYVREAASGKSLSQLLVPNVFVFLKYQWYGCTLFDQI